MEEGYLGLCCGKPGVRLVRKPALSVCLGGLWGVPWGPLVPRAAAGKGPGSRESLWSWECDCQGDSGMVKLGSSFYALGLKEGKTQLSRINTLLSTDIKPLRQVWQSSQAGCSTCPVLSLSATYGWASQSGDSLWWEWKWAGNPQMPMFLREPRRVPG